jgi:phospholipid transport system substrate-binding protein
MPNFAVLIRPVLHAALAVAVLLPAARAAAPADTVTGFHEVLIANMKQGATLGCSGRSGKLAPAIDASFDLPFLASRVMRRHWKTLSAEQQAQFTSAFRELVLATYTSQFATFGGERFDTLATRDLADGSRQVNAKLTPGSGNPVNFDYVLRDTGGQWKIVNVVADGVSDLAIRASQYDKAFKAVGFDGLVKQIQSQTATNKAGC